ncbi:MAG: cyclic nucleotide-binding domain-containing protein [Cyanothece sp. SIO1E1]|nr:cyclic nucleotide-binding domain-containing protein [Cyanothece sp. SIO1E1]
MQTLVQPLSNFPNLHVLTETDLNWLAETAQLEACQPGKVLIQLGQSSDSIYFLLDGVLSVSISADSSPGDKQELKQLSAGEMMGEMSFLDNHPPAATIQTLEPSKVLSVSKHKLSVKLDQDRDFAARFYQALALKLSNQLRELSDLLTQNQVTADLPLRKALLAFAVFNDSDIDWMIAHGIQEKVTPGTALITEGKPVEGVYILIEGTLTISITTQIEGKPVAREVGKSMKGEILGEMSFVETGLASATVRAAENALLLKLPRQKLASKLQADRRFATRFYRAIAVILANRWRDRLAQRGFSTLNQDLTEMLSEDVISEDELDFDVLENTALAGARFDWLIKSL